MGAIATIVNLVKNYQMEDVVVPALRGVTLSFQEGDFIALMGPSGSGKSTLLNLLGCLDRSTSGQYFLGGEDVSEMDDDQLSEVRSRYIGFIFQSYNLLPQYTAAENIEIPLLYQGTRLTDQTRDRCISLAGMVGLGDRLDHRPTQLSGGQQQRVAIARSLVNDPHIILADEPTGNLDSQTSDEIMRLLRKLNEAGKTIIMVTHETDIAAWARRAVRMRDGHIESDVRNDTGRSVSVPALAVALAAQPPLLRTETIEPSAPHQAAPVADRPPLTTALALNALAPPVGSGQVEPNGQLDAELPAVLAATVSNAPAPAQPASGLGPGPLTSFAAAWEKARSGFILALRSLWLHKLRATLSVLGIIIGTAAVIALMAFCKGNMEEALADIRRQGTTNVIVKSRKPIDEVNTQRRSWVASYGLTWDDYDRFKLIEAVIGMVPMRTFPQEIRHLDRTYQGQLVATTEDYKRIHQFEMAIGRFLVDSEDQRDETDPTRFRTVVVLGSQVAEELFPFEQPVGQTVVINKEQYLVVGVMRERAMRGTTASGQSQVDFNKDFYIPIRTCQTRFGERVVIRQGGSRTAESVQLHQVTLTVSDIDQVRSTGEVVRALMERNHQRKDWEVHVPLDRLEEAERAQIRGMILMAAIALISLLVGGIGIMNIMLATVTERTREIGIRRALGAKRRDIITQFLIEAVVQTGIGGLLGVAVGFLIVFGLPLVSGLFVKSPVPLQLHVGSIFMSLGFAVIVGVVFGLYPAWKASRLDPIEALRHN
jgi:ABC-type lipoprotein export system ATPase subunit/ABC-type lipoprotein release transport system permease subunit